MDLIPSFSVDHTKIVPGIFVSRTDRVGNEMVTTYDIRLKAPNREPAIDVAAMHTMEHVIATWLRNNREWKDEVIYWGPMGCLTGFYLILKGNRPSRKLYGMILQAFTYMSCFEGEVPGATPENCGKYRMHDITLANYYAEEFVRYLSTADIETMFEYPKTECLTVMNGQTFYDS